MRKLSGKTINSLALCVALAAPLVYLFGTLFMTLAGSHGNQLIAQPIYTEEYVEVESVGTTGQYKIIVEQTEAKQWLKDLLPVENGNTFYPMTYSFEGIDYTAFNRNRGNDVCYFNNYKEVGAQTFAVYRIDTDTYSSSKAYPWVFYGNETIAILKTPHSTCYKLMNVPTGETPINEGAYSDYLFNQFFAYDNFLAESGREILNGTPLYGFEPIGELVRYTDENMLHLANLSYGPLVIGYTYYCAHIIIVDLIFYIGAFIPRLIKKTINKLEGGLE